MKKFRFRLEALLKQREQIEKDRRRELAEAMRRTARQKQALDGLIERSRETLAHKRARQTGTLAVAELQLCARFLHRLKRETLGADEVLRALRKTEAKKREALLEAAKNRKIYDTLKDHRRSEFYHEAEQRERKETDEIGLNVFRAGRGKPA
ncbi:MAG TPA: flagellar export protein FliJ [candidate division Zixibacteria bacterium]|nr:flagellar export protein FliJ [candidate division Zixibacteria bacterium]MDD4917143.1 flagellar export protein FliJ [candidate division Zixibacteria bacterium]MDM7972673.1 flagellar export protein FliJ [candidate division Zixibacteria bacterium]HOD65411.1 flagellar export protein FliJ [candidate division Zixibacteria bacterium]HOZ06904.1 flagellar export protein FliJ [candidate division Zixibacteria bacterium]